jgi:Minor capsid protein
MSSRYTSHRTTAEAAVKVKLRKGVINMGGDILRLSTPVTPYKHGDLRVRRRVTPTANGAKVQWLSGHAAVQNLGRRAGARPFKNYTTPGTGPRFVEAGIKAVKSRLRDYFA